MDPEQNTAEMLSLASIILLLLLETHRSLSTFGSAEDNYDFAPPAQVIQLGESSNAVASAATIATLRHYRLFQTLASLDEDLGFWVKPRSTTWFSRFILHEYDDERWIQMFRMSKRAVFSLSHILAPLVKKQDTNYRLAVPVTVRIACTLFKLSHGVSLLICSELFAVGCSTVCTILRQVVHAINKGLRGEICWPFGDHVSEVATGFEALCGLPGVVGAIDGTHFSITKPRSGPSNYYYFKSGGYTMTCQAVVDSRKRFLDLYVGMPGSTNDSRVLRRSTLFSHAQRQTLWDSHHVFKGFTPYLLGDSGYPLLPWLMVPHRQIGNLAVAERLFNRRLSRGRSVVENTFSLLKGTFRELQTKTQFHVAFVLDVVTCCALLHNMLLNQSEEDIARLQHILRNEGVAHDEVEGEENLSNHIEAAVASEEVDEASCKRQDLGGYLSLQRLNSM